MDRGGRNRGVAVAASVALVVIVGVVVPLVVADRYGALGIPRNDDWSYLRALFHWVDTGHLDFNNWVSMILLGQLALAAPVVLVVGTDITAVQVLTTLLGLLGLLAVLWLGKIVTGRLWVATFCSLLVAAGPLWGALAVSYMTDIPAFASSVVACVLGARALSSRRVSMPYLVAALVAAFVGSTIRQYSIVPFLALVLAGGWTLRREGDGRRLRTFLGIAIGLAVAAIVVFAFWRTVPNVKSLSPGIPDGHALRTTLYRGTGLLRLLGLLLVPAIILAGPVRITRRAWEAGSSLSALLGSATALLLLLTAVKAPRIALAGNYVVPDGVLGNGVLGGDRPDILPTGGWALLLAIGTVAAVLLVLALVPPIVDLAARVRARTLTDADPVVSLLALVVAGYVGTYLLAALSGLPVADRYVLPILPLAAVLLLRPTPDPAPVPAASRTAWPAVLGWAALVLVGIVGFVYTVDAASFDGTRWKVAEAATRAGWRADQVRGGFEWTNFHAPGPQGRRRPEPCVNVIVDPPGGVRGPKVVAFAYYRSPLKARVPVVALRTNPSCTPSGRVSTSP